MSREPVVFASFEALGPRRDALSGGGAGGIGGHERRSRVGDGTGTFREGEGSGEAFGPIDE